MNRKQLTLLWTITIYIALTVAVFALRSFATIYYYKPWKEDVELSSRTKEDTTELGKTTHQIAKNHANRIMQTPLWKMRGPIQKLPETLLIGLPLITLLGALGIYSLRSHRSN